MKIKYIFWIAATLIAYSYIGYPVWLWLRSRWSPRPVRRNTAAAPAVSAVKVLRNEEAVIAGKLENLFVPGLSRRQTGGRRGVRWVQRSHACHTCRFQFSAARHSRRLSKPRANFDETLIPG